VGEYGRNHELVAAMVDRVERLSSDEVRQLALGSRAPISVMLSAHKAGDDAGRLAPLEAATAAASWAKLSAEEASDFVDEWLSGKAWEPICDACVALVVLDLIEPTVFDDLYWLWRIVVGEPGLAAVRAGRGPTREYGRCESAALLYG